MLMLPLGDLARRARVGNELSPIPTPGSVGLGYYWQKRASAMNLLTGLAKDQPRLEKMARLNIAQVLLVTLEAA